MAVTKGKATMAARRFKCQDCDAPSFATEGGLKHHRTVKHAPAAAPLGQPLALKPAAAFRADLKVAGMLAALYPKGIPTADPSQLVNDLHFIDELRAKVSS